MAPKRSGGGCYRRHRVGQHPASAYRKDDNISSSSNYISSNIDSPVDTLEGDTTATLKHATMELAEKVVVIEERTIFLGDLVRIGRGTKEVEGFIKKQANIRHESKENVSWEEAEMMIEREREAVLRMMENKLTDNILKGARKGRELNQLKGRLLWRLRRDEERRKFLNTLRDRLTKKRKEVRREHLAQFRAIKIDGKKEDNLKLPKELQRYKTVKVFQKDAKTTLKPGQALGSVVVGLEEGLLDEEEISALIRGPKFCVRRGLDEERFLTECEKSYFKLRIDMMEDEEDTGGGSEPITETEDEKKERERIERAVEMAAIEAKTV